jgi:predicted lipid-binding transport protein (Tim44 family)
MKRMLFGSVVVALLAGAGWAVAETAAKPAPAPAAHEHEAGMHEGGMHHCDMMGGGAMGGGMMGGGMMGGGMGPMMMGGPGTKVAVKNVDKGVTLTFTSSDPATVTRLQKMAEAMRLMHEAMNTPEK